MLYLSVFSILIPLIIGLAFFRKLDDNSRLIVILLAFATISQFARLLSEKEHRFIFYNIYTVIDALTLGYMFMRNSRKRSIAVLISLLLCLQVVLSVYVFASLGMRGRFYSEFVCLNSLLQTLWVLSFFYQEYASDENESLVKQPIFWFSLGILIYSPTTYFLFVYYDVVNSSIAPQYSSLWNLHHGLNAALYFMYSIGMLVNVFRKFQWVPVKRLAEQK